jgi:hypothetical protein
MEIYKAFESNHVVFDEIEKLTNAICDKDWVFLNSPPGGQHEKESLP